jgi:hypothetical protein
MVKQSRQAIHSPMDIHGFIACKQAAFFNSKSAPFLPRRLDHRLRGDCASNVFFALSLRKEIFGERVAA